MRHVSTALGLLLLVCQAGLGEEPFRRIVYRATVPLESGAPGVALGEGVFAYSTATTLTLIDLASGRRLWSGPPVPRGGDRLADSVHLLGIVGGKVYACVSRSDMPPDDPKKSRGTMRFGPQKGTLDVVALDIRTFDITSIVKLPLGALVADRLLGASLVYVHGGKLVVAPLSGEGERSFQLGGKTSRRPKVFGKRVVGLSEKLAYVYRSGGEELRRIPYQGTELASVPGGDDITFGLSGDLVVIGSSSQVFACDLDGKRRWRVGAPGHVFTGPRGEVFVNYGVTRRLAPEDGGVMWSACQPCEVTFDEPSAVVMDERLVLFSKTMLTVLDSATGKVVMNMPLEMPSRRRMRTSTETYFRASAGGKFIAIGFDTWVKVIDTTPTGKVPEAQKKSDPANALARAAKLGTRPTYAARQLARDLADTPEAAARLLPMLRSSVSGRGQRVDVELFTAASWIDDAVVVDGLLKAIDTLDGQRRHRWPVVTALASLPDRARALSALVGITKDPDTYGAEMRKWAAGQLTWFGDAAGPAGGDLKLLFSADNDAITALLRRSLRDDDTKARAATLELLKMAPDAVIVALESEFEESAKGQELVREAKARLEAIARIWRPEFVGEQHEEVKEPK
jgi:hypothetical protein